MNDRDWLICSAIANEIAKTCFEIDGDKPEYHPSPMNGLFRYVGIIANRVAIRIRSEIDLTLFGYDNGVHPEKLGIKNKIDYNYNFYS